MQEQSEKSLCLILGGVRSGKSTFAERRALAHGGPVTYLATARVTDEEMRERIAAHRRARPAAWTTCEAAETVPAALRAASAQPGVVLLDCLTNFVANLMTVRPEEHYEDPPREELQAAEERVVAAVQDLLAAYAAGSADLIIVSNEVGLGVVPPYALGRAYRDALGRANAAVAAAADEVYWMVAGLALRIKPFVVPP
jgi:adenosylcobinamide kinase/adenosylcobinamide-phosphate guanylyltransferase